MHMMAGTLALELLILIAIGFTVRKLNIVSGDFNKQFTGFLTSVILPCMIVNSMYGMDFSIEELKNCGYLLLLSVAFLAIEFALAQIAYCRTGKGFSSRILRFGMIFTNFSFMGFPVVETLYGNHGVFYFAIFLIPIRMLYYTCAPFLLSPPSEEKEAISIKKLLKKLLNPSIISVFVGILLYVTGIHLPDVITYVISSISGACSPLGMLLCGITLGGYPLRKLMQPRYARLTVYRNILIPTLIFLLTALCRLPHEFAEILVISAALPVGTLMVAFCVQYDPDPEAHFEGAGNVFYSTLFSIATVPFWAYLVTRLP